MTQVMLSFYLTNHYMKQRIKRYCGLIAHFLFQFAFYFGYISQTKKSSFIRKSIFAYLVLFGCVSYILFIYLIEYIVCFIVYIVCFIVLFTRYLILCLVTRWKTLIIYFHRLNFLLLPMAWNTNCSWSYIE